MKPILAPLEERDGWVYVRMRRGRTYENGTIAGNFPMRDGYGGMPELMGGWFEYSDMHPACRVVTSRRVEDAVETADYLRRCADENLDTIRHGDGPMAPQWSVGAIGRGWADGRTPREAYWRYNSGRR